MEEEDEVDLVEFIGSEELKTALGDLFHFEDEEDNEELGERRESRAMDGESAVEQKAVVEPADQARYNKFIDTFFRRVNADARAEIDPLQVGLIKKKKARKSDAKKGNKKDDGKKDGKRLKDNKKKPKGKKPKKNKNKNKKKQNKKKTGRHPKNLALEGENDGEEVVEADGEAEHHVEVR